MSDRYAVVRRSDGLIVNTILLDAPEPDTTEFRYVRSDAPIGATMKSDGTVEIPPDPMLPLLEQLASNDSVVPSTDPEIDSLRKEIEDLRRRVESIDENAEDRSDRSD